MITPLCTVDSEVVCERIQKTWWNTSAIRSRSSNWMLPSDVLHWMSVTWSKSRCHIIISWPLPTQPTSHRFQVSHELIVQFLQVALPDYIIDCPRPFLIGMGAPKILDTSQLLVCLPWTAGYLGWCMISWMRKNSTSRFLALGHLVHWCRQCRKMSSPENVKEWVS